REILAQTIVGHAAPDLHTLVRHIAELVGVVLTGEDRFAQVRAHLGLGNVECGAELNVADVVATGVDVYPASDDLIIGGVSVVLDAPPEPCGTVAHADDGDTD